MVSSVRPAAACLKRLAGSTRRPALGLAKGVPALALAVALAGCGDTSVGSSFMTWIPKAPAESAPDARDLAKYSTRPTCPGAEIRYGTESVSLFENNKRDNPDLLRFQISVQRVARDCDEVGPNIIARVGAAGRVVAGPKGATGKVDIPVRIAAVNGDKVIYSGLKIVSVQVEAPDFGANWSLVDEAVTIPSNVSADTIIYVGLDDKSKPATPKEAKESAPRPHRPRPPAPAADPADPYPQMKPNIPQ